MKATQRFFKLLELDRKEITYIYLYAIFAGLITLSLPLGIQAIINLMVGGQVSSSLFLLIGIITIGVALNGVLTIMQLTVTETLQRRIFTRSSFEFAWRIPRLQLDNLQNLYPPELINRFFDTITLQKGIPKILIDSSSAGLQILFGLILLSLYHPFFVFFGVTLLFIMVVIFVFTGRRGLKSSLKESKYKYQVAHWLEELGRAMNVFKASGGCQLPINNTNALVSNYMGARKEHFRVLVIQYGSVVLFKTVITAALLFLGSILVIRNQISVGQFVAAEIIVLLIMNSAEKLILGMENIYDVLTALEKIGFLTDLPLEKDSGITFEELKSDEGLEIAMDHLSFQYADADSPIINDISVHIKAGERICIAGYNGSGKSTFTKLLKGLYNTYTGMVTFNGVPLKNINIESLRQHIGSLSTEDEIFNGSVLENIHLGNTVPFKTIINIAKEIDLHDYINSLPDGYATELMADGFNVPRSVRSKVILARILLTQPDLLVLENFLPRIERLEKQNIINFLLDPEKKWSLVAISNSADFAKKCDRVLIFKKGQIVANGHFDAIKDNPYVQEVFKSAEEKVTIF